MNIENILPPHQSTETPSIEGVYVENNINNPFARICCKTRILTPTLCDGTCLDCRKARMSFQMTEPMKLVSDDLLRGAGDNEAINLTHEEATRVVALRIARIEEMKRKLFERQKTLHEKIEEHMRHLTKESGSQHITTLH